MPPPKAPGYIAEISDSVGVIKIERPQNDAIGLIFYRELLVPNPDDGGVMMEKTALASFVLTTEHAKDVAELILQQLNVDDAKEDA